MIRDDDSWHILEAIDDMLRCERALPENRVEATAQAMEWMKSEEQCLVALLEEHYGDTKYTMFSMKIFGAQGQDEDDVFVLSGTLHGGDLVCDVPVTDVYVRFGVGFQRQDAKSATFAPQPVTDEAALEESAAFPSQRDKEPPHATLRDWLHACFNVLCGAILGILIFGGIIWTAKYLQLPCLVFTAMCLADFVRRLPALERSLDRLDNNE